MSRVLGVVLLTILLSAAFCSEPQPDRSICVEDDPAILPSVTEQQVKDTSKALVAPAFILQRGDVTTREFIAGLKADGWAIVEAESLIDIDELAKSADVAVFYTMPRQLSGKASLLTKAPFTKILIVEGVSSAQEIESTRDFVKWGDAVLAREPVEFTKVILPSRILCLKFMINNIYFNKIIEKIHINK